MRLEITTNNTGPLDESRLLAAHLDSPQVGLLDWSRFLRIAGWVLHRSGQRPSIHVECDGMLVATAEVDLERLDVAAVYPHVPDATRSGFAVVLDSWDLPTTFDLTVSATCPDGTNTPIGRVLGCHRLLSEPSPEGLQPLLVVSLGRSGSSFAQHMLGCHPQIVVRPGMPHETRAILYWSAVFATLAKPGSFFLQLQTERLSPLWWTGQGQSLAGPLPVGNADFRFVAQHGIERTACFCRQQIEDFYRSIAAGLNKEQARFASEKLLPGCTIEAEGVRRLYPQARLVFLVRDFRDMIASILAFNTKRGSVRFGRDLHPDDASYVEGLRRDAKRLLAFWQRERDRAHLVRYEDLALSPESTLRGILTYLDLDRSDELIRTVVRQAAETEAAAQARHRTTVDIAASIGRWRHDLPEPFLSLARTAFDDVLLEFGHDPAA